MKYTQNFEKTIITRMLRHRIAGERYKPKEWLLEGLPDHAKSMKELERVLKDLRNKGWIEIHKKGKCISLTRNRKIHEEIKKYVGFKSLLSFLF